MNNPSTISVNEPTDAVTASTVAELAQQAAMPVRLDDGSIYAVLNPQGGIQLLETPEAVSQREESHADGPNRVQREMIVRDALSLLDIINHTNHAENASYTLNGSRGRLEVWADIDHRQITAIHDGGDGWRTHISHLDLQHSAEWSDWTHIDGEMLDQVEFAEFIEDHLSSIGEPDGAQLLDICQTLQAHTGVQFKQQQILANGQRTFRWEETVEAKAGQTGDLKIPGELVLVLRPFQGSQPIPVKARFRFRPSRDGLRLGIRLAERERVLEEAFTRIVNEIDAALPGETVVRFGRG